MPSNEVADRETWSVKMTFEDCGEGYVSNISLKCSRTPKYMGDKSVGPLQAKAMDNWQVIASAVVLCLIFIPTNIVNLIWHAHVKIVDGNG